ncbi:MAG TPA: hypothetical protein VNA14_11990 [Mycobacteriales bacterium]|nr:hypothetical protein [Mycobacteriales bacterium]
MDQAIAQVAALVAHGNAMLAGDAAAGQPIEEGTTFRYVRQLRFEWQDGSPPVTTHAEAGADGWFRRLAESGVTALWLDPRPLAVPTLAPHLLAAWANGSRTSIVTEGIEPRQRWIASSRVDRAPTETDKRVWTITCVGRPDIANLAPRPTIAEATAGLETIVRAARELARRMDATFWGGQFDGALARLTDDDPGTTYHDDVLPPSAELDRRRLFTAAVGAYVFGGMGTWNDIGPPPDDDEANAEYDRVTPALYAAVLDAVAAAVNPRR